MPTSNVSFAAVINKSDVVWTLCHVMPSNVQAEMRVSCFHFET